MKTGAPEDIAELFSGLQRAIVRIVDGLIELTYFMRGAISYEEMLNRTPGERDRIAHFLKERLEIEAKNPFPNY